MSAYRLALRAAEALGGVAGVDAVALGGSHATGMAGPDSDIDIGVYYSPGLDVEELRRRAAGLDDGQRPDCLNRPGDWGPWINGGGWLRVEGVAMDILLRDTRRVSAVVDDCLRGQITIDYQCGHPFGFVNAIYMGEAALCRPLCANTGALAGIRERLRVYPEGFRRAAMDKFLWECEFSLMCGRKSVARHDVLYASGSLFRAATALIYALYACNRLYFLNEKGCLDRLLRTPGAAMPPGLAQAVEGALALDKQELARSFAALEDALCAARELCTCE